ncbi:hypothetical protein SAMN05660748_2785 [Blastococcus aggregatus]|uniref:Lipoprotein n=1 Tax=Blastococcus aggregatus TaxID=38502 RepID=A0A285V7Y2_9ACTN|nr:hypothetical protein [Blastococcus aggregatus]SOC50047.1 hypothetical protein SAMN05660748_2785 [Blastococcus aggregatus]
MADQLGRPHTRPLLAAALVLATLGLSACGDEDDNALAPSLEPASVPDIRGPEDPDDPYVGLLDEAFREDLEAYSQQEVTLLAAVEEVISPRAFTVTSTAGEDLDPVLVVTTADVGNIDPEVGQELVIAATPVEDFDADTAIEELRLDLDATELDAWDDDVYLLATILEEAP